MSRYKITHNQIFDFKYCFVLRVLFPEEINRDYSQLPVVRPWAVRAVVYCDVDVFVPAFGGAMSGHIGV